MRKVALVNCLILPEPDPDEEIVLAGLRAAGIDADWFGWDDPGVDWSRFDLAIVRSTWNYFEAEKQFREWLEEVGTQTKLQNPVELIRSNLHKGYLINLEAKGIPVTPTVFLSPSEHSDLGAILEREGWEEIVIKPAISAGSHLTDRFLRHDLNHAGAFLNRIFEEGDAMIQKYLPRVAEGGEINLIHIGGELTHGIVKRPRFSMDAESVSDAVVPNLEQSALAKQVMETVSEPSLYARVDLMLDEDRWLLSELELIEPSLFFKQFPPALDTFVGRVEELLRSG